MKYQILEQKENKLLNRKEYLIKISDVAKTPTREEVWKQFSAKQGLDGKKLIVDTFFNESGLRDVKVFLKYYDDEKSLKRIELKNNLKKYDKLNPTPKKEEPKAEDAPVEN